MNSVVHFEFGVEDPDRAIDFYTKIFGWEIKKWEGNEEYWMISGPKDKSGIGGGLYRRKGTVQEPDQIGSTKNAIVTINISDIDAMMEKVNSNGGKIIGEKMEIMGAGWMANCIDTEKNIFGIMQMTGQM